MKAVAGKAWNWIKSLFDQSIDLEVANRKVDEAYSAAISQIDDEQQRKIAQRELQRQRKREQSKQLHDATMAQIGSQYEDKSQALRGEYDRKMQNSEDALAKTRKEWLEAIGEARRKRQAKDDGGPGGMESPEDLLDKVTNSLAGLGDVLDSAAKKTIGVKGTFNAAAVAGLAAGGAAERTATATEQTAQNTKKLVSEAQRGGLTFG